MTPIPAERKREVDHVVQLAQMWAAADSNIAAVGLAGSQARGEAGPDSDVDLIVLAEHPERLLEGAPWSGVFGDVMLVRSANFGVLKERRLRLPSGLDIEVGVVPTSWADIEPIDAGTHRVVSDGFVVLFERSPLLSTLIRHVSRGT